MAGYDSMLAEMMLTMGWGLFVGMFITLILIPILYTYTTHRK
jgi:multidrug efflux pump subunit AcrB